jgi:hypothetical protein
MEAVVVALAMGVAVALVVEVLMDLVVVQVLLVKVMLGVEVQTKVMEVAAVEQARQAFRDMADLVSKVV